MKLLYDGATGGYGFNRNLHIINSGVWQPIRITSIQSTSQTIAFTNGVDVDWTGTDPQMVETLYSYPPSMLIPSTRHRFIGITANILFVDGHVEVRTTGSRNPLRAGLPAGALAYLDQEHIYDVGNNDDLWVLSR